MWAKPRTVALHNNPLKTLPFCASTELFVQSHQRLNSESYNTEKMTPRANPYLDPAPTGSTDFANQRWTMWPSSFFRLS